MESFFPEPCFKSWNAYGTALCSSGSRFRQRALARSCAEDELGEVAMRSKNKLDRTLNWWDLMWITVGVVVGSGIFVTTGEEARNVAGPAIFLSYVVAGFSAMLCTFCYTEFAIEVPAAGGSFSFLRIELGDFVAFLVAGNLIIEFVISQAAVARAWTSNLAALIDKNPDHLRIHAKHLSSSFNQLDPIAAAVSILFGLVPIFSTRATATVNWIASLLNMLIMIFIIIAGFAKGDVANLSPFMPYGTKGIFSAASVVYFAYLGFDSVATLGEETRDPARDIPRGLLGSMSLITVVYCLMALALCTLQRYSALDTGAPFAFAFTAAGWKWAQYFVAFAALKGISSSLLVASLNEARYITHIARTHMIPPWFAFVNPKTHTPIRATLSLLIAGALVGFFTSFDVLANLLSISTLCIFTMVALSLLVRRYYVHVETNPRNLQLMLLLVLVGALASSGVTVYYQNDGSSWKWYLILGIVWVISTACVQIFVPKARIPKTWGVPWVPWIPCASIAVNIFLLGAIDKKSFLRFGVMTAILLVYYFFIGLHASYETAMAAKSIPKLTNVEEGVNDSSTT